MIRVVWAVLVLAAAPASLAAQSPLAVGGAAPGFSLKLLTGGEAALSQFRGRPVLVNFWATWCKPCRQEMPEIIAAYQAHHASGLEVLAVNLSDQESMKDVRKFVAELGLPFPILLDDKGKTRERYDLVTVPTSVFIDAKGIVRKVHAGPISANALKDGLAEILPQ
jgi:peroxiredoxin